MKPQYEAWIAEYARTNVVRDMCGYATGLAF